MGFILKIDEEVREKKVSKTWSELLNFFTIKGVSYRSHVLFCFSENNYQLVDEKRFENLSLYGQIH